MTVLCKKPLIRIGALIAEGALVSRGGTYRDEGA